MPGKSKKHAVVVMSAKDLETAKTKSQVIAETIKGDMQIAENGLFYALRAGLGLLRIRDLYEHGKWGIEMAQLFPEKSSTSLYNYMKIASNFCEKRKIAPLDAWVGMSAMRSDRLLAAPADVAVDKKGAMKADPLECDVREFVTEFDTFKQAVKGECEKKKKDGRPLNKAERQEAARGIWQQILHMAQDELIAKSPEDLSDDDLDSLSSVLRTIYDALRKQLAKRAAKI